MFYSRGWGGLRIWKEWGCSLEIWNKTPKRDRSGRSPNFFWPLKETMLKHRQYTYVYIFFTCTRPSRLNMMAFCQHPKWDQNPKYCTPKRGDEHPHPFHMRSPPPGVLLTPLYSSTTGNPNAVSANRKIRCIYPALGNKTIRCIYLPLFLCLYESFWTGFESDQRRLTVLVIKCVICLSGAS